MLLLLLSACGTPKPDSGDATLSCGEGTHQDGDQCVADEDTGGDADTDTDSDTDTDTDADADTDTDTDTDTDLDDADADGFTTAAGDCDDADADVHPGAEEVCGNGKDDDCDGGAGTCGWSGEITLPDDAIALAGHRSDDNAGFHAAIGDGDGDGQADLLVSAPNYDSGGTSTGVVYFVSGPVTADASLEDATARLLGDGSSRYTGWDLDFLPDVDGDGCDELVISDQGAQGGSSGGYDATLYVVHGPVSGDVTLPETGAGWTREQEWDSAGVDLAAVPDVTGDGLADIVVGAQHSDVYLSQAGAAYVVSGAGSAGGDLADADVRILGDRRGSSETLEFGSIVGGVGDTDGDGVDDFAVGAVGYYDSSIGYPGAVYVFRGPLSGTYVASDADALVLGPLGSQRIASWDDNGSIGAAGDQDGDGHDDMYIAIPNAADGTDTYAGAVAILGGDRLSGDVSAVVADAIVWGASASDSLGWGVTNVGDLSGDGRDDLLVGSTNADDCGRACGAAWLVTGPLSGSDTVDDVAVASFWGDGESWSVGYGLVGGADLTGDGVLDLGVSAAGADGDQANAGVFYVLPGGGF